MKIFCCANPNLSHLMSRACIRIFFWTKAYGLTTTHALDQIFFRQCKNLQGKHQVLHWNHLQKGSRDKRRCRRLQSQRVLSSAWVDKFLQKSTHRLELKIQKLIFFSTIYQVKNISWIKKLLTWGSQFGKLPPYP